MTRTDFSRMSAELPLVAALLKSAKELRYIQKDPVGLRATIDLNPRGTRTVLALSGMGGFTFRTRAMTGLRWSCSGIRGCLYV